MWYSATLAWSVGALFYTLQLGLCLVFYLSPLQFIPSSFLASPGSFADGPRPHGSGGRSLWFGRALHPGPADRPRPTLQRGLGPPGPAELGPLEPLGPELSDLYKVKVYRPVEEWYPRGGWRVCSKRRKQVQRPLGNRRRAVGNRE